MKQIQVGPDQGLLDEPNLMSRSRRRERERGGKGNVGSVKGRDTPKLLQVLSK